MERIFPNSRARGWRGRGEHARVEARLAGGPGVPNDNARDVPDVALSAAIHDGYYITYQGSNGSVGGTSAPTPSFAGIVAILNQYQVTKGFQTTPGLGNINPQLYRLAQSAPTAFHDVTSGNNIVKCEQGSPDCVPATSVIPRVMDTTR